MTIAQWCMAAYSNAKAHGFHDGPNPIPQCLCLMHSELSEALEEWRDFPDDLATVRYSPLGKPIGFGIELADLLIRVFDTCQEEGIDIEECLKIKHAYNVTRPHRHGGKTA